MTGTVDAIVFDLDDTLCEYRRSGETILRRAFDDVGVDPFFTLAEYGPVADGFVADSDSVVENRRRSFAELAERAGRDPDVGRAVADAYADERAPANVRWVPGAEQAFESLSERYDLTLVTNGGPEEQAAKLRELGITEEFERIVYAGYDTAPKPDPEGIHVALDAVGVVPERAIKIGDSLRLDVEAAHNAGLESVWLDRAGDADPDPVPDYRLGTMAELVPEPWP